MSRSCSSCGTDVDDSAVFCPSCGAPIEDQEDAHVPPAPAWPDPKPDELTATRRGAPPPRADTAPRRSVRGGGPAPDRPGASSRMPSIPVTWPGTLSGWLIGAGAVVAALGLLIGFFQGLRSSVDVLLLLAFVVVAVTVFFSATVPSMPRAALVTMAVAFIGFGVALDRMSLGGAGFPELLVFMGTGAAAIGSVIVELGHDQPIGRPQA